MITILICKNSKKDHCSKLKKSLKHLKINKKHLMTIMPKKQSSEIKSHNNLKKIKKIKSRKKSKKSKITLSKGTIRSMIIENNGNFLKFPSKETTRIFNSTIK